METIKEKKLKYYIASEAKAYDLLRQEFPFLEKGDIWLILQIELLINDNVPTDLIFKDLNEESIAEAIRAFYKKNGIALGQVQFPFEPEPLASNINADKNILEKGKIAFKNKIWMIHKNDQDPFPSDPHAHEYSNNLKLCLACGKIYRGKERVNEYRNKDFLKLRGLIENRIPNIKLPKIKE